MAENWNEQEQPKTYGEESQMYQNGQEQNQQNYGQPYGGYQQEWHGEVKDVFCYALLMIMPLRIIVSLIATASTLSGMSYESIMDGSYAASVTTPLYTALSMFSSLLFIAYVVFVILDIMAIRKQNYKIVGLVLFAILFNPGYYLWRAHILGRNKLVPIIYTVVYVILMLVNFAYSFASVYEVMTSIMHNM